MTIEYIQKGEPNQNAYIERFNRTYREEVLSLYLFEDLRQVREATYWWRIDYNVTVAETLVLNCQLDGEAYDG